MLDRPLPQRPWLRRDAPILWRDATTVEVGDNPRRTVIADVPRGLLSWVRTVRGDRILDDCLATCPDPVAGVQLLTLLHEAGALDDASRIPDCAVTLPQALRDRALRHHAAARHTYRDDRAYCAVDARASASVVVHGSGPVAELAVIALRQAGVGRVRRGAPPSSAARAKRAQVEGIDLVVLAHHWHPDALDDAGCLTLDLPHLPIAAWGSRGIAGPLVVPGLGSCLTCLALHAHDRDPRWPTLQMQRQHSSPDTHAIDTGLALSIAGHAAVLACAWLESRTDADEVEDVVNRRIEIGLPGGLPRVLDAPPHELCGCRWRSEVARRAG